MKFYTNVEQAGNRLLVRGYENGNRYSVRVPFNPTLYLPTKNYSEWRTLEGNCVEPHKFGSITEARDFVKQYKEVDDFEIYGNSRFLYQYIAEEHPEEEVKFDSSKIRVFTIDIETAAENGFPDIETADQEILAISIKDSFTGRITVFDARSFNNQDSMVEPRESSHFEFYVPGQATVILPLRESPLYIEDRIGLKTLDESGRLHLMEVEGNHLEFSRQWFIDNIINVYLKN